MTRGGYDAFDTVEATRVYLGVRPQPQLQSERGNHSARIGRVVIHVTWNGRLPIPLNVLFGDQFGGEAFN
jgi:hypothetical protein